LSYAPPLAAAAIALAMGWIADLMTGRRGFGGTCLVAAVGALCGWFLAQRVFAIGFITDWNWTLWSVLGAGLSLIAFLLFRSKR
jgi:uncharacterized membrane protein YeaQ/YmgE (transglycosylase-associated protein family)